MKKIYRYCFIAGVAIGIIAGVILLCTGTENNAAGPEDVVKEFTQAVAAGDFTRAFELSDSLAVKDYIYSYRDALEYKAKTDSAAVAIASGLLSEIEVIVGKTEKEKDRRTVFYTIKDVYGHSKEKKAELKKVGREWKVTQIRDNN